MANGSKKRDFGRWKTAGASKGLDRLVNEELARLSLNGNPQEGACFKKWVMTELWNHYQEYCMEEEQISIGRIDKSLRMLPNGTQGKKYQSPTITLPPIVKAYSIEGLEGTGLKEMRGEDEQGKAFYIEGVPTIAGDIKLRVKITMHGDKSGVRTTEREVGFAINPDPRTLWRNIPTPEDIPYYKPDTDSDYIKVEDGTDGTHRKDLVAASVRGRSHAKDGKARDDHFMLYHCPESDWYIIAVADGAGSAKYSRKGSEVACKTAVNYCKEKLLDNNEFEQAVMEYHNADNEEAARKALGNRIYTIVGNAAFKAHKAINEVSMSNEGSRPKDFATTLLLTVCKRFDFGWFYASFWVGDGAICIYDKERQEFRLLGVPDEGEYSGQTRFLTMPEIFKDTASLYSRLRFGIAEDFTALLLMTDGVSDPMFGTDANLGNIEKWNEFWQQLQDGFAEDGIKGVDFKGSSDEIKERLQGWLNFWVQGEHDDRTIAILF